VHILLLTSTSTVCAVMSLTAFAKELLRVLKCVTESQKQTSIKKSATLHGLQQAAQKQPGSSDFDNVPRLT